MVAAINAVYEAFEAADDEGNIALFYRTLEEGELIMDGEMAFDMLSEINPILIERGERGRLDDMEEKGDRPRFSFGLQFRSPKNVV